jgi:hypothetical protein
MNEWYIPVTRSKPEGSCLRNTTLFPINLPARRINTVPGVMVDLFPIQTEQANINF